MLGVNSLISTFSMIARGPGSTTRTDMINKVVVYKLLYIYCKLNIMLTITDYIIIAFYFILILVVGFWTGRKQEKEEFLISGRNLKSLQATSTIFSSRIAAAILLTYTALVYLYGLGAL